MQMEHDESQVEKGRESGDQCVRARVLACGKAYHDAQDSPSQTRSNGVTSRRCFESR